MLAATDFVELPRRQTIEPGNRFARARELASQLGVPADVLRLLADKGRERGWSPQRTRLEVAARVMGLAPSTIREQLLFLMVED